MQDGGTEPNLQALVETLIGLLLEPVERAKRRQLLTALRRPGQGT